MKEYYAKLQRTLDVIENEISNERIWKIKFTVAPNEDETADGFVVADVTATDKDGVEVFGDLNFDTFTDALLALGEAL